MKSVPLLAPCEPWLPYFGHQKRFSPHVKSLLEGLGAQPGDTFFETNAGSHAVSWLLARELGVHPVANDLSAYSCAIGHALTGDKDARRKAARGAALIQEFGFNPPMGSAPDPDKVTGWEHFIEAIPKVDPGAYTVTQGDLFKVAPQYSGRFIYADFAWPWREGEATEEYVTTSSTLEAVMDGRTSDDTFEIASARRILQDVIAYLDFARERFEFVILSNQSSNYPPPLVLEPHMKACGHVPVISRSQTWPAEYLDNLGKDDTFTEYQYVFEGTRR